MLRHFYHVPEPMALTVEKWNALLRARPLLMAMEHGDPRAAAEAWAERRAQLERRYGR